MQETREALRAQEWRDVSRSHYEEHTLRQSILRWTRPRYYFLGYESHRAANFRHYFDGTRRPSESQKRSILRLLGGQIRKEKGQRKERQGQEGKEKVNNITKGGGD